jgi:hypothetical protein
MNPGIAPQSTDGRIVSTSRAYVVYDKATGDVHHVHHEVTFAHTEPAREDAETRARRLAGNKADAEVLEVDPAELGHRGLIRVDTATRKVVRETPR